MRSKRDKRPASAEASAGRQETRDKGVYAVILVGGKGKRLRPLSTNARPKAFLSVTKDRKTMFRKTLDRIAKMVPEDNILVVANKLHAKLVKKDFPDIDNDNLLLEPVSRNTAPAIAFAATALKDRCVDAMMIILPADQYIVDERLYLNAIKTGIDFVDKNKSVIIVLGIKPTFPATGFGYIRVKGQGSRVKGIYKVAKFTEKPNLKAAKRFLKSGKYLWNAGAFIFSARAILNNMKKFAPKIAQGVKDPKTAAKRYASLPDISVDYAVMEHAEDIYCVKGSYRWQDVGSFESLKAVLRRESRKFIEKDSRVIRII